MATKHQSPTPSLDLELGDLILTTFDWVPEMPRGFVRDLRVRWALEEAGLPYRVASTHILLESTRRQDGSFCCGRLRKSDVGIRQ